MKLIIIHCSNKKRANFNQIEFHDIIKLEFNAQFYYITICRFNGHFILVHLSSEIHICLLIFVYSNTISYKLKKNFEMNEKFTK